MTTPRRRAPSRPPGGRSPHGTELALDPALRLVDVLDQRRHLGLLLLDRHLALAQARGLAQPARDAHAPFGHRGIDARREERLATALAHANAVARGEPSEASVAELKRAVGASLGVVGFLQRRRAAHDRVAGVDADFGDALERCGRGAAGFTARRAELSRPACAHAQVGRDPRAHVLDRLGSKPARPSIAPSMRSTFQPGACRRAASRPR
jgi:hypothetical protein